MGILANNDANTLYFDTSGNVVGNTFKGYTTQAHDYPVNLNASAAQNVADSNSLSYDKLNEWLDSMISSESSSATSLNEFNAEQARLNREFQKQAAKDLMDFNQDEAEANRVFQQGSADKAMEWSERMSNTAYQRAVEDLKKAGLNPILAYTQGGASSSGATSASGSMASGSMPSSSAAAGQKADIGSLISSIYGTDKNYQATIIASVIKSVSSLLGSII